jgi:hypothetical protein
MSEGITYRFEFWGASTNNFYGSMLEQPSVDDYDTAYEVNEFYDRILQHLQIFYNFSEPLKVEYVPDPVRLRAVPDNES